MSSSVTAGAEMELWKEVRNVMHKLNGAGLGCRWHLSEVAVYLTAQARPNGKKELETQ